MIKSDSVKKNFIFQIIYQVVILFIPLITAPYLTRTLGDTSLGTYTYSYSIAYYFVLLGMLGISKHGQRIIASRKDSEIALRKTFWSLYVLHLIFSCVAVIAYLIFACCQKEDRNCYLFQSVYVLSALFDVTWLFYGVETFKSVVIKNFILKILETILIFVFVKSPEDILIYTFIMASSACLGQIALFLQAIRIVKPIHFSLSDFKEHFKPMLVLSITVISVSLYTVFDKVLLGLLATKEDVAYYEYSNKIISIPQGIIAVISTVLFPRACACFSNEDHDGIKRYFRLSVVFTCFLGIGSIVGLIAVSNLFVSVYYGEYFIKCGDIIKALSPLIIIVGLGNIVRTQFLIPMKRDIAYVVVVIINAILNLALSAVLIPKIGIYGAIIGTIAAESFGLVAEFLICRKYVDFKILFGNLVPFLIAALCMYGIIYLMQIRFNDSIFDLIMQILGGGLIYCILSLIWLLLISPNKREYRSILISKFKIKQ